MKFLFFGIISILFSVFSWLISLSPMFSYINLAFGALFIVIYLSNKRRFSLKNIKTYSTYFIILFILFLLNIALAKKDYNLDLTSGKIHNLAPESVEILSDIKAPLEIIALDLKSDSERLPKYKLLNKYSKNKNIKIKFLSPDKFFTYRDYIQKEKPGNIYFEYNGSFASLDIFTESEISKALYRLVNQKDKVAYYITGHGEADCQDKTDSGYFYFAETIRKQGYLFATILLNAVREIPDNASFLILNSAKSDYLEYEKESILNYLKLGGKLLVISDPEQKNSYNFFTDNYGIEIGKNVVLDPINILHGAPEVGWQILANNFLPNEVTKGINFQNNPAVFLLSNSVSLEGKEFLFSSSSSWAETNLEDLFSGSPQAKFDLESDLKGPVSLALAFEDESNKILVYGDKEWLNNANLEVYSNKDLLINSVNWLSGDKEPEISKKLMRASRIKPIGQSVFKTILLFTFLIPEILLFVLVYLYFRKRNA